MYLKRLQLRNYGPFRDLDISFPFDETRPTPVLLVGENGSGKTVALSHIVNAMVKAKDVIYQKSSELDVGTVFKLRSTSYVTIGADYYYARSDFESGLFMRELRLRRPKHTYAQPPMGTEGLGLDAWEGQFDIDEVDHFDTNILEQSLTTTVKELVSERSLLYFPSNRAEEPAWLNRANLRAKPQYTEGAHLTGETRRRLIARSPLRDVHDWLYDVAYDRAAFEMHTRSISFPIPSAPDETPHQMLSLPMFRGYRGDANNAYNLALAILRIIIPEVTEKKSLRFGIGGRHNRVISLESDQGTVVPNLFQLSSGEMALLALFLSILRDFDLREDRNVPFASAQDIKGLVVVDEVDLHLHSKHQYDALPNLVNMFPNIQFVMTTHSPLFVLGMAKIFGEEGFQVYDLPSGSRVTPEVFDEFGHAFVAFKATSKFLDEVLEQVQESQRPVLFVEGSTDQDYLQRAAELLGKKHILDGFEVRPAGGAPQLKTIWRNHTSLPESITKPVVLLHDPESQVDDENKDNIFKRKMPHFGKHPICIGIENLFDQTTLEKARQQHVEFIDIFSSHTNTKRGKEIPIPESWSVNKDEKRSLCNWLCAQGTREDFRHFECVFDVLEPLACVAVPTPES